MLAKLFSVTLEGIEGLLCEVEVDTSPSAMQKPTIVGLPDAAVKESIERVRSAIVNSGYNSPPDSYLVNLAPADVKKEGPAFDLPIALGVLACTGALASENLHDTIIVGELALDGRIRPVNGILSMAMAAAAAGYKRMIVPIENAAEAAVVQDVEVFAAGSLAQAVSFLSDLLPLEPTAIDIDALFSTASAYDVDFADVKGQESVKRALTIAAAGNHNVITLKGKTGKLRNVERRIVNCVSELSDEDSSGVRKVIKNKIQQLQDESNQINQQLQIDRLELEKAETSSQSVKKWKKDLLSLRSAIKEKDAVELRVRMQHHLREFIEKIEVFSDGIEEYIPPKFSVYPSLFNDKPIDKKILSTAKQECRKFDRYIYKLSRQSKRGRFFRIHYITDSTATLWPLGNLQTEREYVIKEDGSINWKYTGLHLKPIYDNYKASENVG